VLSVLHALQDPESAALDVVHGAGNAIGRGVSDLTRALTALKQGLSADQISASSTAASALATGSASTPDKLASLLGVGSGHGVARTV
jgi:hypothetical protein